MTNKIMQNIKLVKIVLILGALITLTVSTPYMVSAQSPPPPPYIYSGTVTVDGSPAPDGVEIIAHVVAPNGTDFQAPFSVTVKNGKFYGLGVGTPDTSYGGGIVTFYLEGEIPSEETDVYVIYANPIVKDSFSLTFPNLPIPTPTPTAVPTSTPIPTPTPTAIPPTSTPVVAIPSVYSGVIAILGGELPQDAELIASVGSYSSYAAAIDGYEYMNLVVDPGDISLRGERIEFFLNGVKSRTTSIYQSSATNKNFDLIFSDLPTPTPISTVVPPTPTPVPPTATAVPPTPTPVPPTATAVPPTPVPPTATAVPPTPVSPTATAVPPTPVPPTVVVPTPKARIQIVIATPTAVPTPTPLLDKLNNTEKAGLAIAISAGVIAVVLFGTYIFSRFIRKRKTNESD